MPEYKIPKSIKITFSPKDFPEITNRIYRILYISIAIGHLKDQYFKANIAKAVRSIKRKNPQSFDEFLKVIDGSPLKQYGREYSCKGYWQNPPPKQDRDWWQQVWDLISQNGDIELIEES